MRFRTRDLLLWTTIFAAYAAVFSWLHRWEVLDTGWVQAQWILAVGVCWHVAYGISRRRAAGRNASYFRRRWVTLHHGWPPLCLLTIGLMRLEVGRVVELWPFAVMFLICHAGIEAASHVAVGEEGVTPAFELLSWNDYEFELEEGKLICTPTLNPHERKTKRFSLWSEDAQELRAFLEEKQPKRGVRGYYG